MYVANRVPTSRMSETGVHYTRNDGVAWHRAALQGLGGPMHQLAVHPTDPNQLAVGTDTGLYVSRDWDDNFERIGTLAFVLAVAFDLDGAHLWSSSYVAVKPTLAKVRLGRDTKAEDVPLPPLIEDAVAHIAQDPARRSEIAIATR